MTRAEWVRHGEYAIASHDRVGYLSRRLRRASGHFRAIEIADPQKWRSLVGGGRVYLKAPDAHELGAALLLRDVVLEWLRDYGGTAAVYVSSWYRDAAYNASIPGAAEGSVHMTGGAADVSKQGRTPFDLAVALARSHPDAGRLGIGLYSSFCHVDIRGFLGMQAPARWGLRLRDWA